MSSLIKTHEAGIKFHDENGVPWLLTVVERGGKKTIFPAGTDSEIGCRFGSCGVGVVPNAEGEPDHEKMWVKEAPNTNCIAWGIDDDGKIRIALICQARPHSDDPLNRETDGHKPMQFVSVPMGFNNIAGDIFEKSEDGAIREVAEETGSTAVIEVARPKHPYHNPNPTLFTSWSDLFFIKVDLKIIEEHRKDKKELIYSSEYVTLSELFDIIYDGSYNDAYSRMCTTNSLLLIFFAWLRKEHPELAKQVF